MIRDPNSVASRFQSPGLPFLVPGTCPTQEPPQPLRPQLFKGAGAQLEAATDPTAPWESRMVTLKGTLPSLLLGTLLTFTSGALGANPGLVVGSPTRAWVR